MAKQTSLPPLVEGRTRGHVSVCVKGPVEWECNVGPPAPKLSIRLKWWGEKGSGMLFRVPVAASQSSDDVRTAVAHYPIRAGLPQFKAYLKDMGTLAVEVGLGHMTDSSMVIGWAAVPNLVQLTTKRKVERSYPILSSGGILLGKLHLSFQLHITPSLPSKKGEECAAKPAPVMANTAAIPEFVVGPGTKGSLGRTTDTTTTHSWIEPGSGSSQMSGDNISNKLKTVVGDQPKTLRDGKQKMLGHPEKSTVKSTHPVDKGDALCSIGRRQMEVISELLDRGTRLRDRMVESLTVGTRIQDQQRVQSHDGDIISADVLALMSAELAVGEEVRDAGGGGGEGVGGAHHHHKLSHLYTELSSDDEGLSTDDTFMDGGNLPSSHLDVHTGSLTSGGGGHKPKPPTDTVTVPNSGTNDLANPFNLSSPSRENVSSVKQRKKKKMSECLKTLSSVFGRTDEADITNSIGVEQLTRLARATSGRITVDNLHIDSVAVNKIISHNQKKQKKNSKDGFSKVTDSSISSTYFVEYQFPAALLHTKSTSHQQPHLHEVMRVACKKMEKGKVMFNHRSVFPLLFDSQVIQKWWNSSLIFRVFCRPQNERMPYLVGKAVAPLKGWLTSPRLQSSTSLPVHSSSLGVALQVDSTSDPCIGQLKVSMEMMMGRKLFSPLRSLNPTKGQEEVGITDHKPPHYEECDKPIKLKEISLTAPSELTQSKCPALQMVLLIPEAINIVAPSSSSSLPSHTPNPYLICKLFCATQPYPRTPVEWGTANPQFLFRQLFPLSLNPTLVEKFCNNFSVVEVWHRITEEATDGDQLLGLVKLSLHQFYLAFSQQSSLSLSIESELPVVTVDSYCPIVDPITGQSAGHLAVLLALGTPGQISSLLRHHASGLYPLQCPYQGLETKKRDNGAAKEKQKLCSVPSHHSDCGEEVLVHHQFLVCVDGVRGLKVAVNTVWGEADCFVQYHFPAKSDNTNETDIFLNSYRTPTTLYMPNPSFGHEISHSLFLPGDQPVGQVFAGVCGRGLSGEISFEFWRRFYYPNIRDQLTAKAALPLVKLCAFTSMQPSTSTGSQTFHLPLKLLSAEFDKEELGGVLDVTVSYNVWSPGGGKPRIQPTSVTLSLGVLRMAGLKRAAVVAARDHPLPLDFAAEAGVNPYVRIRTSILPEPRTTKTVSRTFAPELSHFFELPLTLTQGDKQASGVLSLQDNPKHLDQGESYVPRHDLLPTQFLHASLLIEVWHQVPRKEGVSRTTGPGNVVIGRRLGPSFQDILLGVARVPLRQLLTRSGGVYGWYPLLPPNIPCEPPVSGPTPQQSHPPVVTCSYVGGVEVSASFPNSRDRELVLSCVEKSGYHPDDLLEIGGASKWEVKLEVSALWVQNDLMALASCETNVLCFVRYKFFDLEAVSSTPRKASLLQQECRLTYYPLWHKSCFLLPSSQQLQWYLREESLEVQVWACASPQSARPSAGDALIGSVYIPFNESLSAGSNGSLCGWYPVFKVGAEDLGAQTLYVRLSISPSEGGEKAGSVSVSDSLEGEHPSLAPPPISDVDERTEEDSKVVDKLEDVVFEARIIIHEALHLPLLMDLLKKKEWLPNAYVSLHPHPSVEKIMTPAFLTSHHPSWNYQSITSIPNLYLQPQCPGLEFQVWSSEEPLEDYYIGCVLVDLSPLAFGLTQLSGWYHILNFAGEVQGQLKVSVIPSHRTSLPPPPFLVLPSLSQGSFRSGMDYPSHLIPDHSSTSTSTSMLFQQLRDNIRDLDQIHQSLQAKLQAEVALGTYPKYRQHSSQHSTGNEKVMGYLSTQGVKNKVMVESHGEVTNCEEDQCPQLSPFLKTCTPSVPADLQELATVSPSLAATTLTSSNIGSVMSQGSREDGMEPLSLSRYMATADGDKERVGEVDRESQFSSCADSFQQQTSPSLSTSYKLHGYSEDSYRHTHNFHQYTRSDDGYQQHTHSDDGHQQHTHSEDAHQQHTHSEDAHQQHTHSEDAHQQHTYSDDSHWQHTHSEAAHQQHTHSEDGHQQHTHSEEDAHQQHTHSEDGHQQHTHSDDNYQQHTHSEDAHQQHTHSEDSHWQHTHSEDGHQQHILTEDSHQQHILTEDSNQQHSLIEDDHQQHILTEDSNQQHSLIEDGHPNPPVTFPTTSTIAAVHTERAPLFHLPEPHLPNFFLSPECLERHLRTLQASALSRPLQPPPPPPRADKEKEWQGGPPLADKWRTPEETQRIAKIFSSRHHRN